MSFDDHNWTQCMRCTLYRRLGDHHQYKLLGNSGKSWMACIGLSSAET